MIWAGIFKPQNSKEKKLKFFCDRGKNVRQIAPLRSSKVIWGNHPKQRFQIELGKYNYTESFPRFNLSLYRSFSWFLILFNALFVHWPSFYSLLLTLQIYLPLYPLVSTGGKIVSSVASVTKLLFFRLGWGKAFKIFCWFS